MTLRGAEARESGELKIVKAEGPKAGKIRGRSVSQATRPIRRIVRKALMAVTRGMIFFSSKRVSRPGTLMRARHTIRRVLNGNPAFVFGMAGLIMVFREI